jgi:hypothetical protein
VKLQSPPTITTIKALNSLQIGFWLHMFGKLDTVLFESKNKGYSTFSDVFLAHQKCLLTEHKSPPLYSSFEGLQGLDFGATQLSYAQQKLNEFFSILTG